MFIHIGYQWLPAAQWEIAVKLGDGNAISIDFPHIDVQWDSARVALEVSKLMEKIKNTLPHEDEHFVHIAGELCFVVEFCIRAKEALMRGELNFTVVTSVYDWDKFVQFRKMV